MFAEECSKESGGGEGGGIGDEDGEGERSVGENGEESGGGGEINEKRDRVLPNGEKLKPVS